MFDLNEGGGSLLDIGGQILARLFMLHRDLSTCGGVHGVWGEEAHGHQGVG
jgi:hypothetical protein